MNKYLYILILSMIAVADAEAQGQKTTATPQTVADDGRPRLVVNISIDQLRADYLQEFMPRYCATGFKKLLQTGKVYENASLTFMPTDRVSASAALVTGAPPCYNGVIGAEWFSRKSNRKILSVTDQQSLLSPRGNVPTPANLLASAIGDELKIVTKKAGKVYGVAPYCDAAIMLAGHSADGAFWIDQQNGLWTTTSYYNKAIPAWMTSYNKANTFQNKAKMIKTSATGGTRYSEYLTSPYVNSDVTAMALQCAINAQLGADAVPDILNVQYYAGTWRGKSEYDPTAELANTYIQLDAALSKLITSLESRVGQRHILFVISSTGYFDEPAIDYEQYNVPSGTVYINRTANLLNMFLSASYGQAHYVDGYVDNNIYLNHKVIEQKRLKLNEVLDRSRDMLVLSDGITNAYTSLDLSSSTDIEKRLLHNGFNIETSGDLVVETAPGWKLFNEETQKQQQWRQYGFTFPLIIYGADVKHEVVTTPVTTDQIAPTICHSIHIRAPNACKSAALH